MAELNVSKESIKNVLDTDITYIVPDYQRPYRWDKELCQVLWEDIVSFFKENKENKEEYYLGTLVLCDPESGGGKEIIDGQQRVTSFVLMLRAFYKKLEEMTQDGEVRGLKGQIEPCIWQVNPMSRAVDWQEDRTSGLKYVKNPMRIESKTITDNDKESLHSIIERGEIGGERSLYQENYDFFCRMCDDYARENPMEWKGLCLFILNRCILFPIECEDLNTALTIFYTLNDRGMPLSDTDIFKAQIYKGKATQEEKQLFVKQWKILEGNTKELGIEMDSIFRYYSHYIRGKEGNTRREKALRTFYLDENNRRLRQADLISDLGELINFWSDILSPVPEKYIESDGRKYVHCLCHYPNEYWRYAVSVFFLVNKERKDTNAFGEELKLYLMKIAAFFYAKFMVDPNVNSVKDDVYHLCRNLCAGKAVELSVKGVTVEGMSKFMHQRISTKAEKGLLLLKAYLHNGQVESILENFQLEHIFPRQWDSAHHDWEAEDADKYIENIGNKIAIERKLNIQASNTFFSIKKKRYAESNIAELKQLSQYPSDRWFKDDIDKRKAEVIDTLVEFFRENGVIS